VTFVADVGVVRLTCQRAGEFPGPLSFRVVSVSSTPARTLAIAQIGTIDEGGGAATVARGLMRGYAARGHRVWHLVGRKCSDDPDVRLIPDDDRWPLRLSGYTALQNGLRRLTGRFPGRGLGLISRLLRLATHPGAAVSQLRGIEDFDFPATERLLDRLEPAPDLLHGHNLHGGFFDLRALASLSVRVPTVLTLHDMWLLTGHCAHSLDCDRWRTGCGSCPALHLDPAIRRDATAGNWKRKQAVYAKSRLHVATPSQWLRDKVEASMLAPAIKSLRVIPNGVDTSVFRPADRPAVRQMLDLPDGTFVVLLTTGTKGSMWKDDVMLRETMRRVSERQPAQPILFVTVGRESAVTHLGAAKTRSIPSQRDSVTMARYYQAADLYLHAAVADTFPLAVMEAMACGTPVVATAVGGVPEQIRSTGDATGVLVPRGDSAAMAAAVDALLRDARARARLGANAAADVLARFTLDRQVDAYLDWYAEILERRSIWS